MPFQNFYKWEDSNYSIKRRRKQMECNCKMCELTLGIIILVFALWQTVWSEWIIAIAAIILILHALLCKKDWTCSIPVGKAAKKRKYYYSKKSKRG